MTVLSSRCRRKERGTGSPSRHRLPSLRRAGYDRCFLLMPDAMKRRSFLTTLGTAPALAAVPVPSSASRAPRKVVAGTVMQPFWVDHPGLTKRLSELGAIIDEMQAESRRKYGRGMDIAVLPECAVTGEAGLKSPLRAVPLRGRFSESFGDKACEHRCYIVAPTYLYESENTVSNAAVLFGRKG